MSLILDALNRAENERKNQNAVPDLNTLHSPQEFNAAPESRRTLWWAVVVLALIAIIVVLVVVLRRESAEQTTVAKTTAAELPAVVSSPLEQSEPVAVETPSAQVTSTSVAIAVPVVEAAPKGAADNTAVNQLYATGDAEPPSEVDTGVNELYAAEAATTAASETIVDPFNPSGDTARASALIQEHAPPRTFDSITNIPDFNALPWNMRQQIPTISYARHNFLDGGVSSVVINNQTTGVGNIIGTGQFVVQEIFVDGVVLKHGNAVFKLRALTGWINM